MRKRGTFCQVLWFWRSLISKKKKNNNTTVRRTEFLDMFSSRLILKSNSAVVFLSFSFYFPKSDETEKKAYDKIHIGNFLSERNRQDGRKGNCLKGNRRNGILQFRLVFVKSSGSGTNLTGSYTEVGHNRNIFEHPP